MKKLFYFLFLLFFISSVSLVSAKNDKSKKIEISDPAVINYFQQVKATVSSSYNPPKTKLIELRQSYADVEFVISKLGMVSMIDIFESNNDEKFNNHILYYLSTIQFPVFPEDLKQEEVVFKVRLASKKRSFFIPIPVPFSL